MHAETCSLIGFAFYILSLSLRNLGFTVYSLRNTDIDLAIPTSAIYMPVTDS